MKRKLTSGVVTTSGKTIVGTTKPDNIKAKPAVKVVKKVKVPRNSMPNLKFAETKKAQNDEATMRKADRMRKGL